MSLLQYFLVMAAQKQRMDKVKELFVLAETMLTGPDAAQFEKWFALPYVADPASDPRFQVTARNICLSVMQRR